MKILEMENGLQSYNFCLKSDSKRIKHAEPSLTDAAKKAGKKILMWNGSFNHRDAD